MKQILLAMGLAGAILLTACGPKAPAESSDVQSGGGASPRVLQRGWVLR